MNDKLVIGIVIAVVALCAVLLGTGIKYQMDHPCIKSHEEIIHHPAGNHMVNRRVNGKNRMVSEYKPAWDEKKVVCDQRK